MKVGPGGRILIGMLAGVGLGVVLGERIAAIQPVGDLFITLLILAAAPLVFFNLLAGLTSLTDLRTLGRLAGKTVGFFLTTELIALSLGLGAMALLRPGVGLRLTETVTETAPEPVSGAVGEAPSVGDVLLDMIPTNVCRAFADGNVVQIVSLALVLGIATRALGEGPRARRATLFEDLAGLFRRLVHMILWIAPVGIGALVAVTVGRYGTDLIGPMARFLAGLWGAQVVIVTGYMLLLRFFSDFRPARFLRATGSLWATTAATITSTSGFTTASYAGTLGAADRRGPPRAAPPGGLAAGRLDPGFRPLPE